MLVDLGKVAHYHFNKVTHRAHPKQESNSQFQVLFQDQEYTVDTDPNEPPIARARSTWVSSDEINEHKQNEILLEALDKNVFAIGRSTRRDVCIKLKAVSADHCAVAYDDTKGWSISEKGKDKLSSNGTFVFMKTHSQMQEHAPSDLIPLYDGMVLSFINYEMRVNLERKDDSDFQREAAQIQQANQEMNAYESTLKAEAVHTVAVVVNPVVETVAANQEIEEIEVGQPATEPVTETVIPKPAP